MFGCAGSLLLLRLSSSCAMEGLLSSCGTGASHRSGFSCRRAQALGQQASVAVDWMRGLSCSVACGIFPTRRSNLCALH